MFLLGIDLETNADPVDEYITEIGAILYDWDTKQPVKFFSEMYRPSSCKPLSSDVVELTGITNEMIRQFGYTLLDEDDDAECGGNYGKFLDLSRMFYCAHYIVAHNGTKFDRPRLENFAKTYFMDLHDKPWIDTLTDVEYPKHCVAKNMTYLCGYHGFVNPFPHRAVFDVAAMMKVLANYDIERVIEVSKSPTIVIKASVSYDDRQLAKDAGFYWDGKRKFWLKKIKKIHLEGSSFIFPWKEVIL